MSSSSSFEIRRLAALMILLGLAGAPALAWATSCCSGGGGQSVCVLPAEQSYQLGASVALRSIEGHFDPYGRYAANSEDSYSRVETTTVGGAFRLGDEWQLSATLAAIRNDRRFSTGPARSSTALGDPILEVRYDFWDDLRFLPYRPQLSFYGGLRLPIGNSVFTSADPYGTDAVGDGTWTPHLGVNASKVLSKIKVAADVAAFYPLNKNVTEMRGEPVAPYELKVGNRLLAQQSVGYLLSSSWSATAGLRQFWQLKSRARGAVVEGSAARLFTSFVGVTRFVGTTWSFGVNYETVGPFDRYIANQPRFQAFSFSASYGGM